MKGLLIKDFYMACKYCKVFFLLVIGMLIASIVEDSPFITMYPLILAGVLPVTLIAYEEHCKWNLYCGTLPVSRKQLVSNKYLVSAINIVIVIILSSITQAIRMNANGIFTIKNYLLLISSFASIALIPPSILLPFIFKLGSEKGKLAYYAVFGVMCATITILSLDDMLNSISNGVSIMLLPISILVFALSWSISIYFYENREL